MATSVLHQQVAREDQLHWQDCFKLTPFEFLRKTKAYLVLKKEAVFLKGRAVEITFDDLKYEVKANVSRV